MQNALEAFNVQTAAESGGLLTLVYIYLLCFVLSTFIAFVYQKTFRGLSYSRNYVQAIILISIVAATVIQAVGDSLSRGIGIMAAMAIIRFRTNLKDPRDLLFLFAGVSAGVACGAYSFGVAIIGTLGFTATALILFYSPLGPTSHFDGMLRFNMSCDTTESPQLESILHRHCRAFSLVTLREISQGQRLDYAYHIKMRTGMAHDDFLKELQTLQSIQGTNLMLQEATVDL